MKRPPAPDPDEPEALAEAIAELGLTYVVLTMVDRDDIPDGGADHVARAVEALRERVPELLVEVLVSDFQGQPAAIERVVRSAPAVFAHNLETVERLTPTVRDPRCGYAQSLEVLRLAKESADGPLLTKTSLMVGLGETPGDLERAYADLRGVGVEILTLGQYLRPTKKHLDVVEFVTPERFEALGDLARSYGFEYVASGPLVRSSYRAGELYLEKRLRG
jgi:lipoic acid synthetase